MKPFILRKFWDAQITLRNSGQMRDQNKMAKWVTEELRQFRCTISFLSILPSNNFFFTFGVGAVVCTVICSIRMGY